MILKSNVIILRIIKYKDNLVICRCFSEKLGLISTFIRVSKKKSSPIYSPMSQAEFTFVKKNMGDIKYTREITPINNFNFHLYPFKIMMHSIIAEILSNVLSNEQNQSELFKFISDSISNINKKTDKYFDLYLIFIMQLTKFLGISPSNINKEKKGSFFSLKQSDFTDKKEQYKDIILNKEEIEVIRLLWRKSYNDNCKYSFTRSQRSKILNILMLYYQLHIENFRIPKSITVIEGLFQ